jgi:ribosomal protein S18 acetylase RimI-like enzyme
VAKREAWLLDNHLTFLATHRGVVGRNGDTISIQSERPDFTYTLLGTTSTLDELAADVHTVQHLPWSGTTADALEEAGFVRAMGLSYMTLAEDHPDWRVRSDLVVGSVGTQLQMDSFSEVQSRGFCETQEIFDDWHPWLKAANDRNLQNARQIFYVGYLQGDPVGTCLTIFEEGLAGIYAVATLPQHRKKGIGTTIMRQAIADARKRGAGTITLQVKQDSYAEDFYRHLGFERVFATGMYRRNI